MAMGKTVKRSYFITESVRCSGLGDANGASGIVGGCHDVGGCCSIVGEDIIAKATHDTFDSKTGIALAFFSGVDRPPGFYTLAKGIKQRAFLLVERERMEYGGLEDSHIGDDAFVGDALFDTLVVDDCVACGFAAGTCCGGDGNQPYTAVAIGLLHIRRAVVQVAV